MEVQKRSYVKYWLIPVLAALVLCFFAAGKTRAAEYNLALNNEWVEGTIVNSGDANFYKFVLPSAGFLHFDYQGWDIYDSYFEVRDESWATRYSKDEVNYTSNTDPKTVSRDLIFEAGTYYVKVYAYSAHTGNYKLRGSFTPANNTEQEPNNGFDQAMPLTRGNKITGLISQMDRVDFYRIEIPYEQKVSFTYTSTLNDSYLTIWNQDFIMQGDRNEVCYCSADNPKTGVFERQLQKGTYYIKIEPYNSNDNNNGRYYLSWSGEQKAVTSVKISGKKKAAAGSSFTLKADVQPEDATNTAVTWKSSASAVASVDESGKVTAKRAGKATITATAEDGSGVQDSVQVIVSPKGMSAPKLKRLGRGQVKVSWKKQAGVAEYQIQYSRKSNMKGSKKKTVAGAKKTTLSGLKKNKTYYVRIRAICKIDSKKYTGAWSSVVKIKVK